MTLQQAVKNYRRICGFYPTVAIVSFEDSREVADAVNELAATCAAANVQPHVLCYKGAPSHQVTAELWDMQDDVAVVVGPAPKHFSPANMKEIVPESMLLKPYELGDSRPFVAVAEEAAKRALENELNFSEKLGL